MKLFVFLPLALTAFWTANAQDPALVKPYEPITARGRFDWFTSATFGTPSLMSGAVAAGLSTWKDSPPEYGTHWSGYGKRYGLQLGVQASANAIEATAGSLLGEDPRYFRVPEKSFNGRVGNVLKMTVMAKDRTGRDVPNYARMIAIPSASFLSNAWRPGSENSNGEAMSRVGFELMSHVARNAFSEFWPDVRRSLPFHHHSSGTYPFPAN